MKAIDYSIKSNILYVFETFITKKKKIDVKHGGGRNYKISFSMVFTQDKQEKKKWRKVIESLWNSFEVRVILFLFCIWETYINGKKISKN